MKQTMSISTFNYGEISSGLFGRGNFDAYKSAAMKLMNMDVIPTGGIERRDGLRYVDTLSSRGKIVSFEYSSDKELILFFGNNVIDIYEDDVKVKTLVSPYKVDDLKNICWCQKANQLFIVHPDIEPQIIKYDALMDEWSIFPWVYATNEKFGYSCQPFNRFDDTAGISITPSAKTGEITLKSSTKLFTANYVGVRLNLDGGEVLITSIVSDVSAKATVKSNLTAVTADANWQEQTFSAFRGYPKSIAFHQNRLVIGGSKSLHNRLWLSCTGKLLNFDLGTGLDDEAIEFDIFSDKVNEIVGVFSGRHLQVFTSDAEWMVSGVPLTPSNISVSQQTKIGSVSDRYIPPKLVEGSTIFVARNKREIREFFYGDLTENYSSEDLILLSNHLLCSPIEQDYSIKKRTLYVVQNDGTLAVLIINKTNGINAWVQYQTDGKFISVAVLVDKVYAIVERDGTYFLEIFDGDVSSDCSSKYCFENEVEEIENLSRFNGKEVVVNADGFIYEMVVSDGKINLPKPSKNVVVGLSFTHLYCPLPVFINSSYLPKAVRLLELNLRVMETPLLQVDTGGGLKNITFLNFDSGNKFDESLPCFTGDLKIRGYGFIRNYTIPLFKIQGCKPYKLKILNVSMLIDVIR